MTQFHDDEKLVKFLKEHSPVPPPAKMDVEGQLMQRVEKDSFPKSLPPLWVIPGAIVAGLLLTWSSANLFRPTPQPSANVTELETFLVNNWEGVMNDSVTETPENDWLELDSVENNSTTSR